MMRKVIIVFALLILASCGPGSICDNEIVKEISSPDRKYKAIIFKRDCGATTGPSSQLSIIKSDEELENEAGNIFVVDNGEITEIEWRNQRQLDVRYDSLARTFEMKERLDDIGVKYVKE